MPNASTAFEFSRFLLSLVSILHQLRSGPRALFEARQDERGGGGGGEVSGSTCTEAS